jgi:SAM-dependent methyltransferase
LTVDHQARRRAKADAQDHIDEASRAFDSGVITEALWSSRVAAALAAAYLRDDDPRWQSGFDGDAELWRQARELILDAVTGDGTFLDVGCANGHLIECLAQWAAERGQHLAMFGLELNPDLTALARRRLPAWADHIFEGNAMDWRPPMRFTYVRTGLEYVPADRGAFLVARLLREVVAPGGRLIVGPVADADVTNALGEFEQAGYAKPTIHARTDRNGKTRHVVWVEHQRDD